MDNVTHSLVGLMMSRSGIDRMIPRAAVTMVIAANIPDIDVVAGLGGTLNYLKWHRSYTHALVSAPVMALLAVLLVWAILRQRPTLWAYIFSLIAVLSHLVLDWTNIYGIRMLLPFSARWLRLDQTDVVDPWILAMLLLAVAAPALAGLVGSEIGSKAAKPPKRGWAWFALFTILSYEGGRYVAHARALAVMGAHLYNGTIAQRLTALPSRSNPWHWRGVAEGPGFVDIVLLDLAEQFDPSAGRIDYSAETSPAITAASHTAAFEEFAHFNQLPFWKITRLADGTLVELLDLRFGTPDHPGFEASVIVDESGAVRESRFSFGPVPVKGP